MDIKNKPQSGAQEKKDFDLELVYENIRLMIENKRLKEEIKELKRLERWWKGEDGQKAGGGYLS